MAILTSPEPVFYPNELSLVPPIFSDTFCNFSFHCLGRNIASGFKLFVNLKIDSMVIFGCFLSHSWILQLSKLRISSSILIVLASSYPFAIVILTMRGGMLT